MNSSECIKIDPKDAKVVQYLGKSYIKVPYVIINRMLDVSPYEQKIGLVYLFFFTNCNFGNSVVTIDKDMYNCQIGELISTHGDLADTLNMNVSSFRRYVRVLVKSGLVKVSRLKAVSCFHVYGYEAFMRSTETKPFDGRKVKKSSSSKVKKEEMMHPEYKKPRTDLLLK